MESFFGTLKTELVHHDEYPNRDAARRDLFAYIEGYYKCRPLHHVPERVSRSWMNSRRKEFPEWRGSALVGHSMKPLPVLGHECTEGPLTQSVRPLEDRLKHRIEVARRGVDDLHDLNGRGLLRQRLVTIRGALFQLSLGIVSLSSAQSKLVAEISNRRLRIV